LVYDTPFAANAISPLPPLFTGTVDVSNAIYVSVGHRISLETAVALTRACCTYRVPEPVRQADLRSRKYPSVESMAALRRVEALPY
jgi:hypothetical protein